MRNRTIMPRHAVMAGAAVMLLLVSCQGRTAENVEPKGETVEVVVPVPAETDSVAADSNISKDSLHNEI